MDRDSEKLSEAELEPASLETGDKETVGRGNNADFFDRQAQARSGATPMGGGKKNKVPIAARLVGLKQSGGVVVATYNRGYFHKVRADWVVTVTWPDRTTSSYPIQLLNERTCIVHISAGLDKVKNDAKNATIAPAK